MSQADGNPGMNRLAQALQAQMKRFHNDITSDLKLDFGKIASGYNLITNSFPEPIPKGDWMVCRWLTAFKMKTKDPVPRPPGHWTEYDHWHLHDFESPKLKVGDKVLVAWVQDEACVIDVIKSSDVL